MPKYIGDKYITTPEGMHDITKSYRKLSLVYDGIYGDGYFSKKEVPAGIELSNEEYWIKTYENSKVVTSMTNHILSQDNPHNVTLEQLNAISAEEKGASNGLATLGEDGKVPSSQLPSYVDDVLEYSSQSAFPSTGESGKIYIDTSTNLTYRWAGSGYAKISQSLALGETSSTAYPGDKGATHVSNKSNPHGVTASQIGLSNVENKSSATILNEMTSSDITKALGYTAANNADVINNTNSITKILPASYNTGWVDLTLTGVTAYNSTQKPQIRRIGNVVEMRGAVSPLTSAESYTGCISFDSNIFAPSAMKMFVQQGTGTYRFALQVTVSGTCTIYRYSNGSASTSMSAPTTEGDTSTGSWLNIDATWFVDDDLPGTGSDLMATEEDIDNVVSGEAVESKVVSTESLKHYKEKTYDELNETLVDVNETLVNDYAHAVKPTVNGTSITITDSADAPIQNMEVHGKNFIKTVASTQIKNGVTFTNNEDGTYTANGTTTKTTYFGIDTISDNDYIEKLYPKGNYILSGCDGGTTSTYNIGLWYDKGSNAVKNYGGDTSVNITEEISKTSMNIQAVIQSGVTVDNVVFKPMLRLASDTDTTYEPYTKDIDITVRGNNLVDTFVGKYWSGSLNYMSTNLLNFATSKVNSIDDKNFTVKFTTKEKPFMMLIQEFLEDGSIGNRKLSMGGSEDTCGTFVSRFTVSDNCASFGCAFYNNVPPYTSMNATRSMLQDVMMIQGNYSDINYEPYQGKTATIDTETQTGWEDLKTYKPVTNIIHTQSATIDVEYVADTKNYIDNKLAELTALTLEG